MNNSNEKSYLISKQTENLEYVISNILKQQLDQFTKVDEDFVEISARDKKVICNFIQIANYVDRLMNENEDFDFEDITNEQFKDVFIKDPETLNSFTELTESLNQDLISFNILLKNILNEYFSNKYEDVFITADHHLAQFMVHFYHNMTFKDKRVFKSNDTLYGFKFMRRDLQLIEKVNSLLLNSYNNHIFELIESLINKINAGQFINTKSKESDLWYIFSFIFKDRNVDKLNKKQIKKSIYDFMKCGKNYLLNKTYKINYLLNPKDFMLITEFENRGLLKTSLDETNCVTVNHNDYIHFKVLKKYIGTFKFTSKLCFTGNPFFSILEEFYNKNITNKTELTYVEYLHCIEQIAYEFQSVNEFKEINNKLLDDRLIQIIEVYLKFHNQNPIFEKKVNNDTTYSCSHDTMYWLENVDNILGTIHQQKDDLNNIFINISKEKIYMLCEHNFEYKILLRNYIDFSSGKLFEDEESSNQITELITALKQIK